MKDFWLNLATQSKIAIIALISVIVFFVFKKTSEVKFALIFTNCKDNATISDTTFLLNGRFSPSKADLYLVLDTVQHKIATNKGFFEHKLSLINTENEFTFILKYKDSSLKRNIRLNRPRTWAEIAKEKAKSAGIDNKVKLREKEVFAEDKAWYNTKAGRIQKKHPDWSKEDCIRLSENRVWIGMHINMLKYKRGTPNSATPSNYGNGTQWQWCWHDWTPSCFYDKDDDGLIDSYN